jgi:flavorubredoxin
MKAAIIYWSGGGNTERVALAIQQELQASDIETHLERAEKAGDIDWYAYDLLCVGFPSYQWRPPQPMDKLLQAKFAEYRKRGKVRVGAPKVPGKYALCFCTYSGQHTGINEALPAVKYAGQFFEHLGFTVRDDWCIVGQYHGLEEANTQGRLGDIRGRPNEQDLAQVRRDTAELVQRIREKAE